MDMDFEFGALASTVGRSEFLYGVVGGTEVTKTTTVMAELHGTSRTNFTRDTLTLNFGFRHKLNEHAIWIASLGHELRAPQDDSLAVTARISGRDLGSTAADVKRLLDQPGTLPNDVPYTLGGLYEQQQIAFRGLTIILIAAIVLVFLLLLFLFLFLFLYESFRTAIAMMLTTLFAVAGVYLGLWITQTEFNITSRMGMTMIIGIVTEITIFYVSEYRDLPASATVSSRPA